MQLPPRPRLAALATALALAVMLVLPATSALAADTASRTDAEIQARWRLLAPAYSGTPYASTPSWSAPYAAGSLASGFLNDGLKSVNYARYLAGLPDDVVLDASLNDKAQHGAVLLAAGQFAHSQPKPADMDQAFYDIANAATSSSNIGWGYATLSSFNFSCMDDDDAGNIAAIGHRRWILDPPMAKTGMGFANTRTDLWAFDKSRTTAAPYDAVKWPCAGAFPVEMFGSTVPWSVTLNPSTYSWTAGTAGHTVTLKRTRDGKTWTFTSADTNTGGEYFNFETNGYGVSNCFIFRPDPSSVGGYQVGDVFEVTLSGGITRRSDGSAATISYTTRFMSQTSAYPSDTTAPSTSVTGVPAGWSTAPVTFSLTATDTGGSGVAHTYYRLGSGASVTYTGPVAVSADGATTVTYWSVDAAGNTETGKSATVRVDRTPPVTSSDAATGYPGTATIHLFAGDAGSGVASTYWRLDGGAQTAGAVVSAAGTGGHSLEFWSTDVAGLSEAHHTVTFTITPASAVVYGRIAGGSRYLTSIELSKRAFPHGAAAVVIATGEDFPDALCAGPLARALGGPVLLTPRAALTTQLVAELERLAPVRVVIVGGTTSVASAVAGRVASLGSHPVVTRLSGADRYDTAAMIARELKAKAGKPSTVVVATGLGYADAMAAAPLAAAKGWPILLTRRDTLPGYTSAVLAELTPSTTLIAGSDTSVSDAVASKLTGVARKGGRNRWDTSVQLAEYAVTQGMSFGFVGLTTGLDYPDALSASPLVSLENGVLVLVDPGSPLPAGAVAALTVNKAAVREVDAIGNVVPDARLDEVRTAVE
jgi:putative cell wall-binding protein